MLKSAVVPHPKPQIEGAAGAESPPPPAGGGARRPCRRKGGAAEGLGRSEARSPGGGPGCPATPPRGLARCGARPGAEAPSRQPRLASALEPIRVV